MNKRMAGTEGERQAAEYLEARSFRILERNFRCTQGEIDIIGVHEGYLVFVEVKYRSSDGKGSAAQAVNMKKQRRICRTADYYRYVNRLTEDTSPLSFFPPIIFTSMSSSIWQERSSSG